MGHKAEYVLKADEFREDRDISTSHPVNKDGGEKTFTSPASVDIEQIRRVVEEVVDSKLKPVSRNIARLREDSGPDFNDIVGGIGYIIGLMGVALYFKSKEKK